ncbi:PACE efflux transporter [Roseitranquillus sediminis]|uniref:PACE efflux transporter n=1 Tax=Roseitranquillus sediminis TaxID=2809051 RepID=UPI001D0C4474|nr:PACE efflux transporter [Roseitranquillus sediminis]MBM9594624.1 PACE efflux transporter [Roseitranquillus sediminis]
MRNTRDRIRQALAFEAIGLTVVTPLIAWLFGGHMGEVGVLAVIGASLATFWHYAFNWSFDRLLLAARGRTDKTLPLRVVHALAFEGGLLVLMLPVIAWWLDVSLAQALAMDVVFAAFYVVYAFVFTWAYDRLVPPPAAEGDRRGFATGSCGCP